MIANHYHDLELNNILSNKTIQTVFHPIYNLNNSRVLGYEALSRGPEGSTLQYPDGLFKTAIAVNRLADLEILCFEQALANYAQQKLSAKVFINISPDTLVTTLNTKECLRSLLDRYRIPAHKLIIELTEINPVNDLLKLKHIIDELKSLGTQFAIDDLGTGHSGLMQWATLQPEYAKIDRFFIKGCCADPVKKEFLRALHSLGTVTHSHVIAEGIETEEEFNLVQQLGICFVQGFLFTKPESQPQVALPTPIINRPTATPMNTPLFAQETVTGLLERNLSVEQNTTTLQVMDLFRNNKTLHCIPVVDQKKPVGIVLRSDLMECFSMPFGHSLYDRHPISLLMEENIVVIESDTSLDELSHILTDDAQLEARAPFVITHNGQYAGIGSIRMLLKQMTEAKIQHAKYANPLTMLPGNVPIDREVDRLLSHRQSFHLAYLDLDNFKPFNDLYGYSKGDLAITLVARLLRKYTEKTQANVGHIGGDDFVIIFQHAGWYEILQQILFEFDHKVLELFTSEHIKNKGYYANSRVGQECFYPLLSLSAAVVSPDPTQCRTNHEVAELASSAKKQAKKQAGSSIFVCRRRSKHNLAANPTTKCTTPIVPQPAEYLC
ncbi:GGDEF domain-containing protein [Algibacillus agarilyticus]|uniref:GGDEF domain-containing protein n=1 Tax=Algibacillus agarilyticus TaxID=2234133 RepID=UPI000DD08F20|nr:bifunctional diguanylate cyclase/phosphodiesterase [Algibacillus agarilyticus]